MYKRLIAICLACFAIPAVWFWLFSHLDPRLDLDSAQQVHDVEYVFDWSTDVPVDVEWSPLIAGSYLVTPPLDTNLSPTSSHQMTANIPTSVWYRIAVPTELMAAKEPWSLWTPSARADLAIHLDHVAITKHNARNVTLRYLRTPHKVDFPGNLIDTHTRYLYIHLIREANHGTLHPTYLGPTKHLTNVHDAVTFRKLTVPSVIASLMTMLVILLAFLRWLGGRNSGFGWLAATLVLWIAHTLANLVEQPPVNYWLWVGIIYAFGSWVFCVVVFYNRLYDFQGAFVRWQERIMLLTAIVTLVLALGLPLHNASAAHMWFYFYIWMPHMMFWASYSIGQHIASMRRGFTFENQALFVHGIAALIIGGRDVLWDIGSFGISGSVLHMQYFTLVSACLCAVILARRFVQLQKETERHKITLENEIAKTQRDLNSAMEESLALQKRQTQTAERTRMTRDMHDGLGGQLTHLVALSEYSGHDTIREAAESALTDLRFIIDSGAHGETDIVQILANFRHRTQRSFDTAGIRIDWQVDDIDEFTLSPEASLHLLRILQEVSTNTIRHSSATMIQFKLNEPQNQVHLVVQDNGVGFPESSPLPGRGLGYIQTRAEELGAECKIQSATGTQIELTLSRTV